MPSTLSQPPVEPKINRPTKLEIGPGPTKVAVVGAGYIADYHLEILQKNQDVELTAICDLDPERARRAAERFGARNSVTSMEELAKLGVQIAHVLVPPDLHARVGRELLELGIGVFLEKPFALTSKDGQALVELAKERGLPIGVNHNNCFHPSFVRLRETLESGAIGRLEHVKVTLSVPLRQLDAQAFSHWMFREPRNIIFEQAPHPFSQLYDLIGKVEETRTTLLGTRELNPGQLFHDRWAVAARGERGTAELYFAFGQDFTRSTIEVLGTDGMLEADLHNNLFASETKSKWLDFWNSFLAGWRRGGSLRRSSLKGLYYYLRQTLGLGGREDAFYAGMRDSIHAFHRSLRAGKTPRVDGEHGVSVLEWCEAVAAPAAEAPTPETLPEEQPAARPGEICVLGAAGFIGRRVLEQLDAREANVTAVVRRRHGLPPEIMEPAGAGRLRVATADLEDGPALHEALAGAETVLHLATGGGNDWETVERAMVQGSLRVAEACVAHGVKRLVYVSSTAALYLGHDCGDRVVSDRVGPDPEPKGRSVYGRGKIAAEEALRAFAKEKGLNLLIVRPAVVVGPGTPLQHSGIGLWVRDNHCVGWGTGRRPLPLVLAEDVADALVRAAVHEGNELDGASMNLSSKLPITASDLVATYRRETGRDFHFHARPLWVSQTMEVGKWIVKRVGGRKVDFPSYRDLKTRELWPELSCETARNVLGWKPCDEPSEFLRRMFGK